LGLANGMMDFYNGMMRASKQGLKKGQGSRKGPSTIGSHYHKR